MILLCELEFVEVVSGWFRLRSERRGEFRLSFFSV
jgi:hypothetical protein